MRKSATSCRANDSPQAIRENTVKFIHTRAMKNLNNSCPTGNASPLQRQNTATQAGPPQGQNRMEIEETRALNYTQLMNRHSKSLNSLTVCSLNVNRSNAATHTTMNTITESVTICNVLELAGLTSHGPGPDA